MLTEKILKTINEDVPKISASLAEKATKATCLKADNGWEKDNDTGIINQWGRYTFPGIGTGGAWAATITLPITFPNKITGFSSNVTWNETTVSNENVHNINSCVVPLTPSSIQLLISDVSSKLPAGSFQFQVYWEVKGY